jgi:hypothetical protein
VVSFFHRIYIETTPAPIQELIAWLCTWEDLCLFCNPFLDWTQFLKAMPDPQFAIYFKHLTEHPSAPNPQARNTAFSGFPCEAVPIVSFSSFHHYRHEAHPLPPEAITCQRYLPCGNIGLLKSSPRALESLSFPSPCWPFWLLWTPSVRESFWAKCFHHLALDLVTGLQN